MPTKKSMPSKAPARSKKMEDPIAAADVNEPVESARGISAGAIAAVAVCVVGAVILIGVRSSAQRSFSASTNLQPDTIASVAPVKAAAVAPSDFTVNVKAPAAEATTGKSPAAKAVAVTIAGCLERNNEAFRLTDTDSVDVPKSRSWKSGFLKKSAPSLDVVDAASRLTPHVGQRVSVSGMLADRQLRVRSLRRIASTCS